LPSSGIFILINIKYWLNFSKISQIYAMEKKKIFQFFPSKKEQTLLEKEKHGLSASPFCF
jgi:hypothetical protein